MAFKEYTFDDILCAMQNQGKEYDVELIKKAYDFGAKAHEGQF